MQHASAVLLSYNRLSALRRTLTNLRAIPELHEIIVVDNASTDGTPAAIEREFPHVRLIALTENTGICGYNIGVAQASNDVVVILDDDSWPDRDTIPASLRTLQEDSTLGGVALLPRHPGRPGQPSEWPFANRADHCFPVFGCGNVVRREAWNAVGGYESSFFLYRNDVDLALKLLGAGWGVSFNPDWIVWHDSPAAAIKSERWLRTATRNYLWLCRRHGEGHLSALLAMILCSTWALTLAARGSDTSTLIPRITAACRGIRDGIVDSPPALHTPGSPAGLAKLLRLQLTSRSSQPTSHAAEAAR